MKRKQKRNIAKGLILTSAITLNANAGNIKDLDNIEQITSQMENAILSDQIRIDRFGHTTISKGLFEKLKERGLLREEDILKDTDTTIGGGGRICEVSGN